jgi:peroxiredoxin
MRIFLLVIASLAALAWPSAAGPLSGRRAPGFSLPDSKLRQHDLQNYRGKLVLIEIMQTTCPHCRTFAGVLEQVNAKYPGRVAILTVVNPPDTTNTVQAFIGQYKITTPVLFDCGQMSASYLMATPERPQISVPHLFIIDAKGAIVDDYGYSAETKEIFEGKGLFPILDRLLGRARK